MAELANLLLLALCWACTLSASTLLTSVGPFAAEEAGASTALAPLAIACFLFGSALTSIPSAWVFKKCGRRGGFLVGCALMVVSGATGAVGLELETLELVYASTFLAGLAQGFGQFYRFAAMEVCSPARKPFAVTLVLSGGVLAAFAGPQLAIRTRHLLSDSFSSEYTGSFIMVGVIGIVNAVVTALVRYAPPGAGSTRATPLLRTRDEELAQELPPEVPLHRLMLQPRCMVAVAVATVAHTSMVMLMSPLTVAMKARGIADEMTTLALELHFFAMFAPGFLTGKVIAKVGPIVTSLIGVVLFGGAAAALATGEAFVNFVVGMALCGVSWNLCFSSGTLMLSSCYTATDAPRVQGANDFIIFFVAGSGSFASGYVYSYWGWTTLICFSSGLVGALLVLLLAFIALTRAAHRDAASHATGDDSAKGEGGSSSLRPSQIIPAVPSVASVASSVASETSELSMRASIAGEAIYRPYPTDDEASARDAWSTSSLPRLSGRVTPSVHASGAMPNVAGDV